MTSPVTAKPGPARDLELATRLVGACPSPAFLVDPGGRLRHANDAAIDLLGLDRRSVSASSGPPVRELLGVGWRELLVISRAGDSDLVADLPVAADGRTRGVRVRVEPVAHGEASSSSSPAAIVAFLDTASPRRHGGNVSGPSNFDSIFGHDEALLAAKEAAVRFARTLLPVLLLAETGTGKELLARALHEASPRRDQPFVAINCGALSPHLLESELFGYAPGAFTGASREGNDGKIGAARGGTLLLDEVAEMPGSLQALLLRVLEDGTYYRVGENQPRQADVRLICATCRDLPQLVDSGGFRQDLFYRINGACLSLPPLRLRTDVADLALHLLECLGDRPDLMGDRRRPPRISAAALDWMSQHPWPGNVRQLKTALQHALILCDGDEIGLEHLPAGFPAPHPASPAPTPTPTPTPSTTMASAPGPAAIPAAAPAARTLAEREVDRLVQAVDEAGGNLSRAAERLDIARSTLYRRLRKHGLID